MRKPVISIMLLCFVFLISFLRTASAIEIPIVPQGSGIFFLDDDGKWRCNATITLTNVSEDNITIVWFYFDAINVTFIDGTHAELLDIPTNETVNLKLEPGKALEIHVTDLPLVGFDKRPEVIYGYIELALLEAELLLGYTVTIPEFTSFLILPLFIIVTLLTVIIHRRKHPM